MKRLFSVLIITAFIFNCISASAYDENAPEIHTSGDFSYILNDENGVTIKKYNGANSEVVIPSEISGKTVTCIDSHSFSHNYRVEKVIIPDGVTRIENFAFRDCESLKEVILSDSLIFIGEDAFAYCAIEEIVFPESLEYISGGAFAFCESLEKRRFESSETKYFFSAFKNTPFEESYKDDILYYKSDNSPLFIKKTVVFFKGISLFAPFNGDHQYMSDIQFSVSALLLAVFVIFVLFLIVLFFWYIRKGIKILFGEANKHAYSKFNTAFIKEFGNLSYGLGKYKKSTTFGERFFKKSKSIFWLIFWSTVFLASLGTGLHIYTNYYSGNILMFLAVALLSVVAIPLAIGLLIILLKTIRTVFSKIKHGNSNKKVMRIVDVRKRGVKYE